MQVQAGLLALWVGILGIHVAVAAVVLDILVQELIGVLEQILAGNHSTQVQVLGWDQELQLQILDGLLLQLQLKKVVVVLEQDEK